MTSRKDCLSIERLILSFSFNASFHKLYMDRVNKIRGMLTGVALGDALGAPHEFRQSIPVKKYTGKLEFAPLIPSRFQGTRYGVIGQVSDDTEMTLALANSLLDEGGYKRDSVIRAYEDWANSKPVGMGKNTRRLFHGVKTVKGYQQHYDKAMKEDLETTQSNGSLMRATPLALLIDPETSVKEDVYLSNPNHINEEAAQIYVMMVALALRGADEEEIFKKVFEGFENYSPYIQNVLRQIETFETRDLKENKGWVLHALYAALLALKYYEERNDELYTVSINEVILRGGDTDTNAAIAGGLLGALIGYEQMSQEPDQKENIDILMNAKTEGGSFPRPTLYHPGSIEGLSIKLAQQFP